MTAIHDREAKGAFEMREILFRGKDSETGEWVFGWLMIGLSGRVYIVYAVDDVAIWKITPRPMFVEVDPATVGQYTGLTDKNGKKIYEGDVVTYPDGDGGYEYCDETISSGVVTWGDESALFYITNNYSAEFPDIWDRVDEMEIIGNIHDAPDKKGESND